MDEFFEIDEELLFEDTGLVDRDECVMVFIDIQEKLLAVMSEAEQVLKNATTLARFANIAGLPVLVTEQEKLGPTKQEISSEIKDFRPFLKLDFDANEVPEFARKIMELDRDVIVLAGIESHICVTQTALSLLPFFRVHVIADAVSSRTRENKDIALRRMSEYGATISSTEMFICEVLKRAGTDEFKEALKLIK